MIRDIASNAGGAQIKILSDKQSEREFRECIISIAGHLENKIKASGLILEQIEIFKNGGPILVSGKGIFENSAIQWRHTMRERSEDRNERKRKSRSRSRSRSFDRKPRV